MKGLAIRFDILGVKKRKESYSGSADSGRKHFSSQIGFFLRVTTNRVTSSNVGETKSGEQGCIDGLVVRHQQVTHAVRVKQGTYHTASGTNAVYP